MGEARPSPHICLIVQVFLLHSVCNISFSPTCHKHNFDKHVHRYIFAWSLPFLYSLYAIGVLLPSQDVWWLHLLLAALALPAVGFAEFFLFAFANSKFKLFSSKFKLLSLFLFATHAFAVLACLHRMHLFSNVGPFQPLTDFDQRNVNFFTKMVLILSLYLLASSSNIFSGRFSSDSAAIFIAIIGVFL
jgi:hypothetical protein